MLDLLFAKRASLENPNTSLSDPAAWLYEAFGAMPTASRITITEQTALQITAFWSAVNTISDTLAELPLKLVQRNADGSQTVIASHPALRLLKVSPNPFMTPIVFKSTLQSHTLTHGNGYALINFGRDGAPQELWPLDCHTVPQLKDGALYFSTNIDGVGQTLIPAANVLHVPALARKGIAGMSIIAEQRESLAHGAALQQFAARFFGNSARPGGLVSFDGKVRDPEKVRKAIETSYNGENAHGLMVLDNGAKYTPFAIPPDDAQFLASREFSVDDIGRMFRLPAHFLNKMGQATFNNLEQMGAHFVQYTMMPWIARWEQEATRKLLTDAEIERGMAFKFDTKGLMRGDIKTRSEVYTSAITNGWMTRNEVRALEEMNPLDGLDDPLMPLNMTAVGDEPEEEPANEPADEPDDEEDEDETEDENDSRALTIIKAMAERCITKEVNAAQSKFDDLDALQEFYDKHARHLAENLAIGTEVAAQYCATRMGIARETSSKAEFISQIQSNGAVILMELATGVIG